MKDILDIVMASLFVIFMIWIVVGYHIQKGHHKRGENSNE